jgi:hypothetical protein
MTEYRCADCEGLLEVEPDPMHTGGMVVKPCEACREDLDYLWPAEDDDE